MRDMLIRKRQKHSGDMFRKGTRESGHKIINILLSNTFSKTNQSRDRHHKQPNYKRTHPHDIVLFHLPSSFILTTI